MKQTRFFYPALIFIIWLITYIICQFVFPHRLGWDEVAYLSVARGIAENFDFGARAYTIMGLLRDGYPTHLINFPIYSTYLALFFKLFGVSLKVAYFSTWLAAFGVCISMYFIFLKLVPDNRFLAFLVSISYLFYPSVLRNCDTALMEQVGCLLLSLATLLLLKEFEKGIFNYFSILKIALFLLLLWLYKPLLIGFIFGTFLFIVLAYSKITGKKITSKVPLYLFLILTFALFSMLFFIAKKYVFYPVATMLNFHPLMEAQQTYADPLGGLFNNFSENILSNIGSFIKVILGSYFIYPTSNKVYTGIYATYQNATLTMTSFYVLIGVYLFLFLLMAILLFASWKKLSSNAKIFILFALGSIIMFNFVLTVAFKAYHENYWRYQSYYLPLFLCSLGVLLHANLNYFKPFWTDHKKVSIAILLLVFVSLYIPLSISSIKHFSNFEKSFHDRARINADMIRAFIKDLKPAFVYFNDGIHTTFVDYPIKQIFKDATNEQLIQVNTILPEPIEFLFLRQYDWLFQINKDQIEKKEPIINNQYVLYGYTNDGRIVVYRHSSKG